MLIAALCDYYKILAKKGEALPQGYSNVNVDYLVGLTPQGKIAEIIDWQVEEKIINNKNKEIVRKRPRVLMLPKRTEKSGVDSNFIEHRPTYIFGLNYDNETLSPDDRTDKAKKSFEAYQTKQLAMLEGIDTPIVNAFREFVANWNPTEQQENPFLLALGKGYSAAGYAFCLAGSPHILLHEDTVLNETYLQSLAEVQPTGEVANCAIYGRSLPIARIHGKLKGVTGGLATGTLLVGFNNTAEESYGKKQSFNSNISEQAMQEYTEALNYLLKSRQNKTVLDDVTVLHWAMAESDLYDEIINQSVFDEFGDDDVSDGRAERAVDKFLSTLFADARQGTVQNQQLEMFEDIDPTVEYYMVGMKPNVSRLSIKFIYKKRYGQLLQNIAQHQADMQVNSKFKTVPLWHIKRELVSPKSSNEAVNPALMDKMIESIMYGYNYPDFLLQTVIRRIKTDSNDDKNSNIKLNSVRAGIVKACVNRKMRLQGQKEEIKMALDKTNKNPAYLCGRLFAVLEKLQQEASGGGLNRTIKDSYFASACSQPAVVFPKIIRLAQNHLNKVEYAGYINKIIGEILMELNNEFPKNLSITDQGKFILGYYQQFYHKTEKKKSENIGGTENE